METKKGSETGDHLGLPRAVIAAAMGLAVLVPLTLYAKCCEIKEIEVKKQSCTSIISKLENTERWRIASKVLCENKCMYEAVDELIKDELVNNYRVKEPSEVYEGAIARCREEL